MADTSVLVDPLQLCAPDSTYLTLLVNDRPGSPPDGNLTNSAMHAITFDEVHCLASLHEFQPFDPLHFRLQHPAHNSRVYDNVDVHHYLTSYGPPPSVVPVYTNWFRPGFSFTTINTENDIYEYLTQCQFMKLGNVAESLYWTIIDGSPVVVRPGHHLLRFTNTQSGRAGRPDILLTLPHGPQSSPALSPVLAVELKTNKACKSFQGSTLGRLCQGVADRTYTPNRSAENSGERDWKVKAQALIAQVWNQSNTRRLQHQIISTSTEYLFAYREGNTYFISAIYDWNPPDLETRRTNWVRLVVYVTHAMLSRYPTGYAGPHYPLVLPYLASPLLDQYVAELPPPPTSKQDGEQSGEQSHDQQGGMQYAFKWFYQMVIPRVKPSSVVMYTGQRAGRSFALKELTNMETKKITYRDALLCLMELISDSNGCKVYRGKMDNKDVVAKVMSGGEAKERMKVEKDIYDRLLDMQGSSIPQCYGLFECLGSSYILVLSHCGDPLEAFSTLHKADKLQLMNILINIHKRGVIHNDVEPRNVVRGRQRNQLSLIDFGLSEVHKCGRFCDEIDNATMELEI